MLRGHVVGNTGSGPLRLGSLDVWSTLANVQRQGHQEDHVLVPRHCRVPRNEAVVARLGGANVRALADEYTYAEGDSQSLNECLVQAAIGGAVVKALVWIS